MTRSPELDPRQADCWNRYINPKSETFANAKQSAISAGYEENYAAEIKNCEWFKKRERKIRMKDRGEEVLEEMLDLPVVVIDHVGTGDKKTKVVVTDVGLVRIKQDTAKFVTERLGKDDGWSQRSELTGPDGIPLFDANKKAKSDQAIDDFLSNDQGDSPKQ